MRDLLKVGDKTPEPIGNIAPEEKHLIDLETIRGDRCSGKLCGTSGAVSHEDQLVYRAY